MIRFRPLQPADISELVRLDALSNPYPWREADLLSAQAAPAVDCRVILSQEQCIGYLVVQRVCEELELQQLVIFSDWQSQGFGREALASLLAEQSADGVEKLFLEVRASNDAARRLYRSLELVETGVRKDYYATTQGREDAILMQLNIPRSRIPA